MNHVAFTVPEARFDEYVEKLHAKGIETSDISNHDDSPLQVSRRVKDGTFLRSIYFFDPDGALLEFACWTKPVADFDRDIPAATAR
jgi:catechol 2,3-dioxygenase-like lactoylglutathione lyase family enzyme